MVRYINKRNYETFDIADGSNIQNLQLQPDPYNQYKIVGQALPGSSISVTAVRLLEDVTSTEPGLIAGKVTDKNDQGIQGATIKAVEQDTTNVKYTTTNSDGSYSIDVPKGGTYHVIARFKDSNGNVYSDISKPYVSVESAIPDSVVDDFEEYLYEDQNLTLSDVYNGDLASYTRQTSIALQKTYSLEYSDSANDSKYILTSDDDRTVSDGNTYAVDLQTPNQSDLSAYILFGFQDTTLTDGYGMALTANDRIQIVKYSSGSFNILSENDSLNYNIVSDEQYTMELVWQTDGTITVELFDSTDTSGGTVTTTDTSYTSGGIGFRVYNTTTNSKQYYFDHFRTV